jgi:hypothetical protein
MLPLRLLLDTKVISAALKADGPVSPTQKVQAASDPADNKF